jgi:hypothetical protein
MTNKIRILLVNDTQLVCNRLAFLPEGEEDLEIMNPATTEEAVLAGDLDYDPVLINASLPVMGLSA